MKKSFSTLVFFVLCILIASRATAQQNIIKYVCVSKRGSYPTNSTYQTNLYTLFASLTSNRDFDAGFYSSSHGKYPDKVYATGLCRGYVKPNDCRSCLNDCAQVLAQFCPNQKEAIGWYENCTFRYANRNLSGIMEMDPFLDEVNEQKALLDVDGFSQKLKALFNNLRSRAVAGGTSPKYYAVGNVTIPNYVERVYALVQCTPDLSGQDCDTCVAKALGILEKCCYASLGVYLAFPSCMINYDLNNFYDLTADAPIDQLPPPTNGTGAGNGKKKNTSPSAAVVVVPSVCAFMILVIICLYSRMRMGKRKLETKEEIDIAAECLKFNFGTISSATNGFSDENKLGQGGFGAVYKGRLSNGQEIAVKRQIMDSDPSGQGDLEFKNEVVLVTRLGHRNLVKLLGFCLEKNERLLVYELVRNSSLDRFIFDPIQREKLSWDVRFKIIIGIARGLLYLHEESSLKIIHRDLKANNILLDAKMNPKIADFGTARLFAFDQSDERTGRIVGTFGYMAPEYARRGQFSVKSDVFSFGVLVLEIVSGQKVKHFRERENVESLLTYAWKSWSEGKAMNLADPIMKEASDHEIIRCIQIGLLCVQEKVVDRPDMGAVVLMLSTNSPALRPPLRPAYFMRLATCESGVTDSNQSENDFVSVSDNVVSVTELCPR